MGIGLGVKPGDEMREAITAAEELGIPFVFCDRDIQITLRRAWASCGLLSKAKLLASLLASAFSSEKLSEEEVEGLKNASELDGMMSELSDYLPQVKETLIDERDRYLAVKIWNASSAGQRTLAVIGAGHRKGLCAYLEKLHRGEASTDLSAVEIIPPKRGLSKAASWLFPVLLVLILVLGFFRSGASVSLSMLLRWVLWNGSLSALGTFLALGHPLSALAAFVGAPIATISPVIAVGFFSGIVEASLRKPRVQDAETLADDISSLKGVYRNRILRALLVFFLSTLGGALGNFISIPALLGQLAK
jgi:pheromone shutdown-related protein TraB